MIGEPPVASLPLPPFFFAFPRHRLRSGCCCLLDALALALALVDDALALALVHDALALALVHDALALALVDDALALVLALASSVAIRTPSPRG